jgi:alpha-mannosidase
VRPHHDQLPDCNQDYHTAQQWVDLSNEKYGVTVTTLDAPIVMFGDFNVAKMLDGPRARIKPLLLSLPMTNYYHCNYAGGQLGAVTFHYRLYPHGRFDAPESSRVAMEAASPLISHPVMNPSGTRPSQGSLVRLSNPAIVPLAIKPSARDEGLVLRIFNTSDQKCVTTADFPSHKLMQAWACDGLENPDRELPVAGGRLRLNLIGNGTMTLRIRLEEQTTR